MSVSSVAVCIPTYNQAQFLRSSVESACRQTYRNVEVWVSDDASTDETPYVMAELSRQFPQLRYIRAERNRGISTNCNELLRAPEAEFIVRLDSDDVLAPIYVERLVSLMKAYPTAGYAHAAVDEVDSIGSRARVRRLFRMELYQDGESAVRAGVSGYRVAANICLFRADALRNAGYYKSDMKFAEDWDLSIRLADMGWGNVYLDEVLASYRVWTDKQKIRPRRKIDELRGSIRVYDESLTPAFRRRNWDCAVIDRQRRKYALGHAAVAGSTLFSVDEQGELVKLLRELGDSRTLDIHLWLVRMGLQQPLEYYASGGVWLRDCAKRVLRGCAAWLRRREGTARL